MKNTNFEDIKYFVKMIVIIVGIFALLNVIFPAKKCVGDYQECKIDALNART